VDRAFGGWRRKRVLFGGGALATAAGVAIAVTTAVGGADAQPLQPQRADGIHTATPIKHVVVIFGENISFDH
jgi:phospholipase C